MEMFCSVIGTFFSDLHQMATCEQYQVKRVEREPKSNITEATTKKHFGEKFFKMLVKSLRNSWKSHCFDKFQISDP